MLAQFYLWKKWSDQAMQASADLVKRSRALSQLVWSDPPAVGCTPAETAYSENKLRLFHYLPSVPVSHPLPLLVVPSIINRFYILDLKPGRSLVEYLRDQGFDVWMIDWGTPGDEDRFITFDEHIDGYLARCVRAVCQVTGQSQVSLLGYCVGGVLTTAYVALYGENVRNLINLAAPIDFHDEGMLSLWAREENFPVDLLVDAYGNMPDWLLQTSFKWLKPTTAFRNWWTLWERLDDRERLEDFLALSHWVEDNIMVPGETYRKFVRQCYQQNLLVQNRLEISGRRVDLGDITCPVLIVTSQQDHICPSRSATVLGELVSSEDQTLLELEGGHIGMVAGSNAVHNLWPRLSAWLAEHSG